MTDQEIKEAQKSFRVSIIFYKWIFIIYGNCKRRIIRFKSNQGFRVLEFHPFTAKNYEEL